MRDGKPHRNLEIWKAEIELVNIIYKITSNFLEEEEFGLISQIKRAAVSIPSNIAEGASRQNPKEFVQFLYISLGSLSEVETQVILSKRLKFVENINEILDKIISIKRMLNGLIRYVKEGIK